MRVYELCLCFFSASRFRRPVISTIHPVHSIDFDRSLGSTLLQSQVFIGLFLSTLFSHSPRRKKTECLLTEFKPRSSVSWTWVSSIQSPRMKAMPKYILVMEEECCVVLYGWHLEPHFSHRQYIHTSATPKKTPLLLHKAKCQRTNTTRLHERKTTPCIVTRVALLYALCLCSIPTDHVARKYPSNKGTVETRKCIKRYVHGSHILRLTFKVPHSGVSFLSYVPFFVLFVILRQKNNVAGEGLSKVGSRTDKDLPRTKENVDVEKCVPTPPANWPKSLRIADNQPVVQDQPHPPFW